MPRSQSTRDHERKKKVQRRSMSALYVLRVRNGQCPRCGQPRSSKSQTCEKHAEMDRQKQKARFERRKNAGSEIG